MEERLIPTGTVDVRSTGRFKIFDHFVKGRIYRFIKDSFWRLVPRTESGAPFRRLDAYLLTEDISIEDLRKIFEKSKNAPIPISQIHSLVSSQINVNPKGMLVENDCSNLFFCQGANRKIILLSIARQGKKGWSIFSIDYFGGKLRIRKGAKLFL